MPTIETVTPSAQCVFQLKEELTQNEYDEMRQRAQFLPDVRFYNGDSVNLAWTLDGVKDISDSVSVWTFLIAESQYIDCDVEAFRVLADTLQKDYLALRNFIVTLEDHYARVLATSTPLED